MNAFENIIISNIKYFSKTLIVFHKIIIKSTQTEAVNFI